MHSYVGGVILDPFNGSGTTTSVAKKLKRSYIGFDITPEYCKLAEDRLV
jgi:DNA modification methylase